MNRHRKFSLNLRRTFRASWDWICGVEHFGGLFPTVFALAVLKWITDNMEVSEIVTKFHPHQHRKSLHGHQPAGGGRRRVRLSSDLSLIKGITDSCSQDIRMLRVLDTICSCFCDYSPNHAQRLRAPRASDQGQDVVQLPLPERKRRSNPECFTFLMCSDTRLYVATYQQLSYGAGLTPSGRPPSASRSWMLLANARSTAAISKK